MIQKIDKISNLGQYRSFSWKPVISDFTKFNVFYGWNGTGKSTLSSALALLSTDTVQTDFPTAEIQITDSDGLKRKGPTQSDKMQQLYIFNQDFIEENIDWNNMAKTVIFVSKEKIDERKKLDSIKSKVTDVEKKVLDSKTKFEKKEKGIDSFLVKSSKSIKTKFKQIQTTDSIYFNYNKATLRKYLDSSSVPSSLSDDQVESNRKIASSEAMLPVDKLIPFNFEQLKQASEKVEQLCFESITAKSIEFLKENPKILITGLMLV